MADDLGVQYTDKKVALLEKKINQAYKQAGKEIEEKLQTFTKKSAEREKAYLAKVAAGTMSQDDFDKWKQGQVFYGKAWQSQADGIAKVLADTNKTATAWINNEKADVFSFNGNYTAFDMERGFGVNFGFDLYNEKTVATLLKDNPKILPKSSLSISKDEKWNMRNIRSQVTQGILQGESIPKIANRLATLVPERNADQMILHARTAMTSAQNGGRQQRYKDAEALGIKFKKVWLATLDSRTRPEHQDADGQAVKPKEDFIVGGYELEYPGDPKAPPEEIYNCRCTMVTELDDYPSKFDRRAYKEWVDENGKHRQSYITKDTTYNDWYIEKMKNNPNASLHDLQKVKNKLETQINKLDVPNKTFEGIWYNQTVTYADYEAKKDSIPKKKEYYEQQIAKLQGTGISTDFYEQKLKELEDFEKNGKKYADYSAQLKDVNKDILALKPPSKAGGFNPDAYSQERRDLAVWARSPMEADKVLRAKTGEVWKSATAEEKAAIYDYTMSYHKFNEPLRGIEYGTSEFKGVGNTDLNAGWQDNGNQLNAMTDLIGKCSYDDDIWLQRGVGFRGMDKFFECDLSLLEDGTQEELERELLGKIVTEHGFMSCGSSKGQGFSGDIILNVYAPSGTNMMYVEPFSHYGAEMHDMQWGNGLDWDGVMKQTDFGSELETILQQGTSFTVEKITRESEYDTIYVDLWVSDQSNQQRWTP